MGSFEAPVQKRRLWNRLSDGVSRFNVCVLVSVLHGLFCACSGKQTESETASERETPAERCYKIESSVDPTGSRYLTNAELNKELEKLEKRFKQQSEILERHGLRKVKVPSAAVKPAKRYHGDIEPDLHPDPLAELVARVRPERYDDERFEKLGHVVQTFMVSRVSRFVRQGAAASRPIRTERLTIP